MYKKKGGEEGMKKQVAKKQWTKKHGNEAGHDDQKYETRRHGY
jgi:hypothetical protein